MPCAPPKSAERIASLLIPPACREEVLGDLQERCQSRSGYVADALCTIPLVILSRIRRVTDPQVMLSEAFVLYLSFLGAQMLLDRLKLVDEFGYLRLAIPAAIALLSLRFIDVYAKPKARSFLQSLREAALAIGVTIVWQGVLSYWSRDLSVQFHVMLWGGCLSILLLAAVRVARPVGADLLLAGPRKPAERTWNPVSRAALAVFVVVGLLVAFAILRTS